MDLLSEAIGSVRIGRAAACRFTEAGAWGMRYPAATGSGFHILVRGGAWLITAGGEPRPLGPGDVVFAPSGAGHGFSHTPCSLESLPMATFDPDVRHTAPAAEFLCGAYWLEHGQPHHYLHALPEIIAVSPDYDSDPDLKSLTRLLYTDTGVIRPGAAAVRSALLDLILTGILRQWLDQSGTATTPEITDPAIAAVVREIHADPGKPWTVQRLAELAHLSRTAFTRRFTAVVGTPPMAYLIGRRLARGAELLRGTTAPVATIARQVGYSTAFAFGSAFRREYGIAPGRYRELDESAESQVS